MPDQKHFSDIKPGCPECGSNLIATLHVDVLISKNGFVLPGKYEGELFRGGSTHCPQCNWHGELDKHIMETEYDVQV